MGRVRGGLVSLLEQLRGWPQQSQGYGLANLVALLRLLRGVYLQGVEMQDAQLSGVLMRESVFTEAFDATWAVAISRSGQYWAAASKSGEVRVWREAGQM